MIGPRVFPESAFERLLKKEKAFISSFVGSRSCFINGERRLTQITARASEQEDQPLHSQQKRGRVNDTTAHAQNGGHLGGNVVPLDHISYIVQPKRSICNI